MGRTRKAEDLWMPQRVYRGKSKYEYRPKEGGAIPLCPLDAERETVWAAYAEAVKKPTLPVEKLAGMYFASRSFLRRAPGTQNDYLDSWKMLAKVFTGVDSRKVLQKHVRAYMDKRGETSEVRANRELSLFSNIFAYGFERSLVKLNPCKGVKLFPETPRDKYIEDEEYYPYLEKSTPLIKAVMELSYLQGSRGQDVRKIRLTDLNDMGVFIQQGKTGKKQIKERTQRLQDAIDLAMKLREEIRASYERARARGRATKKSNVFSDYLIVNTHGQSYTASGLKSMWAKNRQRIKTEHGITINWTYHDVKAKGISDFEGDKQKFSGHKTPRQVDTYDRKTHVVPTVQSDLRPLSKALYSEMNSEMETTEILQ